MSPAALVRAECANLDPDDLCLMRSGGYGDCLVLMDKRCRYFEDIVLPIADQPSPRGDRYLQQQRQSARQTYRSKHALAVAGSKEGRLCACGEPLVPRQRSCDKCRRRQRRLARQKRKEVARAMCS